jgi:hypothetical protein
LSRHFYAFQHSFSMALIQNYLLHAIQHKLYAALLPRFSHSTNEKYCAAFWLINSLQVFLNILHTILP